MTATVHLIRHCAHEQLGRILSGRMPGLPLSAAGAADANALADRWRDRRVGAIHASPRRRAQQTAAALGAALALPIETVDALDEVDFGTWTGRAFAELDGDPLWQRWNSHRATARAPNGETMAEAVDRAVAHLDRLARTPGDCVIICVSHSDIIRGVVARTLGIGLDRILDFDVDPGSVTTLVAGDWGKRLIGLNRENA